MHLAVGQCILGYLGSDYFRPDSVMSAAYTWSVNHGGNRSEK
jgi:hypothetical protein